MKLPKDDLIDWVHLFIQYNADIGQWDDLEGEYEVKNTKEMAEHIVIHILLSLSNNQNISLDQLIDQELDLQWDRVKNQLIDQGNDL
jgi:hypothetical protein